MALRSVPTNQNPQQDWMRHLASLDIDDVLDELNSRPSGLSDDEVELARNAWGANEMERRDRPPLPQRLLSSFADPFTLILVVLATVSLMTDVIFAPPGERNPTTTAIILAMVVMSGLLRFVQETRGSDAAAALARSIETTCSVTRAETGRVELPLVDVVVGDIVQLGSGDIVPADARVIRARDLFVAESALTGESEPREKLARLADDAPTGPDAALVDLDDLVFMGTSVVSGTASCIVCATGRRTMLGGIARNLSTGRQGTAYDRGIRSVSVLLLRLMLVMAPVIFLVNGATKGDWLQALLFALSIAVGLTPEMLPMIVAACLAKGAVDLSHDRVIVKRLDSIQNLGSMDLLCTDKTGTLTEDRVVLERNLDVLGREDAAVLAEGFLNSFFETGLRNLIDSAIIRRAQELSVADEGQGGPQLDIDALVERYHLVDELPFDYERRRLSVVVGDADGNTHLICKGAIEEILTVCSRALVDGGGRELTDELREAVLLKAAELAGQGMRVLGVARKANPAGARELSLDDERDMLLIGYLAFLDPPKRSAGAAISALLAHGVTTKVLTGDSLRVAKHVCQAIGLDASADGAVLDGATISGLDDAELAKRAQTAVIFAKLSPDQKARVVGALRERGHVVGFMGDGVNDAAAMRASDCGISVDSGADVAKDAADIILLEKDLRVLERGVEEGRRTYANMNKYVKMTASSNFGNIFSVLLASLFLPFLPMSAVQLLLLNFMNDLVCSAIPWDRVDERRLEGPCGWSARSISSFMRWMGPVSSLFDIVTFVLLFTIVCPAAAGGAWGELCTDAARETFVGCFQAGWFAESMITQILFMQLVRTEDLPLVQSRADWRLSLLGLAASTLALALPLTPVGAALGMVALPGTSFALLGCVPVGYCATTLGVKALYLRKHGHLL